MSDWTYNEPKVRNLAFWENRGFNLRHQRDLPVEHTAIDFDLVRYCAKCRQTLILMEVTIGEAFKKAPVVARHLHIYNRGCELLGLPPAIGLIVHTDDYYEDPLYPGPDGEPYLVPHSFELHRIIDDRNAFRGEPTRKVISPWSRTFPDDYFGRVHRRHEAICAGRTA